MSDDRYPGERFLPEKDAIVLSERQAELFWESVEVLQTHLESSHALQTKDKTRSLKMTSTIFQVSIPIKTQDGSAMTIMAKVKCIGSCIPAWIGKSCGVSGCNKKGTDCTKPRCEIGCIGDCTKESSVWGSFEALALFSPLFLPI